MSDGKIKITIDPLGNVETKVSGFLGETCFDATRTYDGVFAGGKTQVTRLPEAEMIPTQEIHQEITH